MRIEDVRLAIRANRLRVTDHADEAATADALSYDVVFHSVTKGEIIEDYPDDKPYPCVSSMGRRHREIRCTVSGRSTR